MSRGSSKDQAEMDPADMEDVEEVEEDETGEDVNSKGWSWHITSKTLNTRKGEGNQLNYQWIHSFQEGTFRIPRLNFEFSHLQEAALNGLFWGL